MSNIKIVDNLPLDNSTVKKRCIVMKPQNITKPSTVVEQIHKSLSAAILNQELKPGTPLKEVELQQWFGVSRAPIREAIRLLESEGLVVVNAYKKKYVRKLSHDELEEIYSVLGCLEGFAASLAPALMTEADFSALEENIRQMETGYREENLTVCTQLNFEFHSAIIKASANTVLRKSISSIMKSPGWFWLTRAFYNDPSLVRCSIADHTEVLKAIIAHDPEKAERAMRSHFSNIRSSWKDQM